MTQPFRHIAPKRTCTKKRANYNAYKTFLAEDLIINVVIQIVLIIGLVVNVAFK